MEIVLMEDTLENTVSPASHHDQTPQSQVQDYIDNTLAAALAELDSPDGNPAITLKRRYKKGAFFINYDNGALETSETETQISYTWPGRNRHEAWRFSMALSTLTLRLIVAILIATAVVIRVLEAIAQAIESGLVVSKRDIYYNDPACFGSQRVVDMVVDDIAHTIGVDRAALNVEAAAKGLVAGYYQLTTSSDKVIDARFMTNDVLIPRAEDIKEIDMSDVKWVLILEKEAVYRRLARSSYHTRAAAGKGILVTGKGYPDLSTRAFVRRLLDSSCRGSDTRFYALVDNDPDGMAIMSTYKFGSRAHARENSYLNAPELQRLGLCTSDVVSGADPLGDDAFIPLTPRDRRKAVAMLKNSPVWAVDGPEPEWRAELQQMLMLNLKAETEILYQREGGLEGWIDRKMAASLEDR